MVVRDRQASEHVKALLAASCTSAAYVQVGMHAHDVILDAYLGVVVGHYLPSFKV